jgi:hypothetical protein
MCGPCTQTSAAAVCCCAAARRVAPRARPIRTRFPRAALLADPNARESGGIWTCASRRRRPGGSGAVRAKTGGSRAPPRLRSCNATATRGRALHRACCSAPYPRFALAHALAAPARARRRQRQRRHAVLRRRPARARRLLSQRALSRLRSALAVPHRLGGRHRTLQASRRAPSPPTGARPNLSRPSRCRLSDVSDSCRSVAPCRVGLAWARAGTPLSTVRLPRRKLRRSH